MRHLVFRRLFHLLHSGWRRRYLIITPLVVMPLAGLAIGALTPNSYKTFATILIQEPAMQNPFLKDLMVETNLKKRMDSLRALVHSRHILKDVATKQGMIGEDDDPIVKEETLAELSKSLTVSLIGHELVRIEYESKEIDGMVDTLNMVALRFVERVVAPQRYSIFKSRDFLQKEMEQREAELLEAEQRLASYKSDYASELPELHARNVIRLSQIKDLLSERKTTLKGAKARYQNLKERLSQTNPVVGRIEEQVVTLLGELAVLRARYTDQHSSIRGLLRKISALEKERARALQDQPDLSGQDLNRLWDRAASLKTQEDEAPLLVEQLKTLQGVENEIQGLAQEVEGLEAEFSEVDTKVRNYGQHEREITALERTLMVKRQIYEDLSSRHQLAQVTGALGKFEESDRIKMIDPPYTPTRPSNLPLFLYALIGLVAGVFLGVSLATVSELISRRVYSTEQFERLLDVPVIGRLPPQQPKGFTLLTGELDLFSPE